MEKFVSECRVCQQIKTMMQASGGLLQPLPIPTHVWDEITMDFITGLPMSKGQSIILVMVDHLSKCSHFGSLLVLNSAAKITELFTEMVVKLHSFPCTIVPDRDVIFMGKF